MWGWASGRIVDDCRRGGAFELGARKRGAASSPTSTRRVDARLEQRLNGGFAFRKFALSIEEEV